MERKTDRQTEMGRRKPESDSKRKRESKRDRQTDKLTDNDR